MNIDIDRITIDRIIIERLDKRQSVAGAVTTVLGGASILAEFAQERLFVTSVAAVCYLFFAARYFVALYKARRLDRARRGVGRRRRPYPY